MYIVTAINTNDVARGFLVETSTEAKALQKELEEGGWEASMRIEVDYVMYESLRLKL